MLSVVVVMTVVVMVKLFKSYTVLGNSSSLTSIKYIISANKFK
jgi:hypothetical protein